MAIVPVRHLPDIGPQPSLMAFEHQTWSNLKTMTSALAELDAQAGLSYAALPDVRGWNAAMCQMVTNNDADSLDILTMLRQAMHVNCLNRQDKHGMTIVMLGIYAQQPDGVLLPFLQDTRFDVGLVDGKDNDVLWYAAYFGRTELIDAIRSNPYFHVGMYEKACQIANKKRKLVTERLLQMLRNQDAGVATLVAGGLPA